MNYELRHAHYVLLVICCILVLQPYNTTYSQSNGNEKMVATVDRYKKLPTAELLKLADSFFDNKTNDSAMVCYSLIYNSRCDDKDTTSLKLKCKALNKASTIYFYHCDYKLSLELLLKALNICEKINYEEYLGRIYNNIGNVYSRFKDYKLAKKYYLLAYKHSANRDISEAVLNNLGVLSYTENKFDSALLLYRKASEIRKSINKFEYNAALNNIGIIHRSLKNYDSAFMYYREALNSARKCKLEGKEAVILSNIGPLHFELRNYDSAVYYLNLSNRISGNNKLFDVLTLNFLSLSEIEEARGNIRKSLDYYKKHSTIKDSFFSASEYGNINELQFVYDMSKVDNQIKELNVEQEIKDRTISMQRIAQSVMLIALTMVVLALAAMYLKNKNLNMAYNKLVLKNVEILNFESIIQNIRTEYEEKLRAKDLSTINSENVRAQVHEELKDEEELVKYKNKSIDGKSQDELMSAILKIMNESKLFCDPDFSLIKLADMVNSNSNYVSYIINRSLEKNFRTFINEYRIKLACKMLSDPDNRKYSIESISKMVGFKSKGTFNPIFKEITGVTPSFYVKSINNT